MKRCFGILFFLIPLSMMLNVHQSKTYLKTKLVIGTLQREQNQLLEENQRIIAEIARYSSPTVIDRLAQSQRSQATGGERRSLSKIQPEQILRIILPEENLAP